MKKYICVVLAVGILAACERKTETVAPGASPTAAASSETTTTTESPATAPTDTTPPSQ